MKKIAGVLLAAALLFSVVGCCAAGAEGMDDSVPELAHRGHREHRRVPGVGSGARGKGNQRRGRNQGQAREDRRRRHRPGSPEGLHGDGAPGEGHAGGPRTRSRACHHGGNAHRGRERDGVHHGDDLAGVRAEVLPLDDLLVPVHRGAPRRPSWRHGRSSSPT